MFQPAYFRNAGLSALFILILGVAAWPQTLSPADGHNKTYPLVGTVLDSVSGRPIGRAEVSLATLHRTVLADPQGDFSLGNVPAGKTQIMVSKPGYFPAGQPPINSVSSGNREGYFPENVEVGPEMGPTVLKLSPAAVITGTVLGENDEPLEGVQIDVARLRTTVDGKREIFRGYSGDRSDKDGHFHIADLGPGRYYISANQIRGSRSMFEARENVDTYPALVYFPASTDLAGATPLELSAGQHQEVNFKLARHPGFKVAGILVNTHWKSFGPPQFIDQLERPVLAAERFDRQTGAFEFRGVPAGTHWLKVTVIETVARVDLVKQIYRQVTVQSNITDLRLSLQYFDIPVVVRNELVRPKTNRGLCTYLTNATSLGEMRQADCSQFPAVRLSLYSLSLANLRLESDFGPLTEGFGGIHGVSPGSYIVQARSTVGGYIQAIRCGGIDLMREPLVVTEAGNVPPIEVVIRDDSATLNIHVRTDKPSQALQVFVLREPGTTAHPPIVYRAGANVTANELPPGEYRVFAFDNLSAERSYYPDTLYKYAVQATRVSVGANQSVAVAVNLIHAED